MISIGALLRLARWYGARYGEQPKGGPPIGAPIREEPGGSWPNLGECAETAPAKGIDDDQRADQPEDGGNDTFPPGGQT